VEPRKEERIFLDMVVRRSLCRRSSKGVRTPRFMVPDLYRKGKFGRTPLVQQQEPGGKNSDTVMINAK
jgi:hypothetical protein